MRVRGTYEMGQEVTTGPAFALSALSGRLGPPILRGRQFWVRIFYTSTLVDKLSINVSNFSFAQQVTDGSPSPGAASSAASYLQLFTCVCPDSCLLKILG